MAPTSTMLDPSVYQDARMFPAYISLMSFVVLVNHAILYPDLVTGLFKRGSRSESTPLLGRHRTFTERCTAELGNKMIFLVRILRLDAVFVILTLEMVWGSKNGWDTEDIALAATSDYLSILAALGVAAHRRLATVASVHLTVISALYLFVYASRDISVPWVIPALDPVDSAQGAWLWVKIALLAFVVTTPGLEPK